MMANHKRKRRVSRHKCQMCKYYKVGWATKWERIKPSERRRLQVEAE